MERAAVEAAVTELQRQQLGLFTRAQAVDLGLSAKAVDGRVRRGRYRRLLPGVYADDGLPNSWEVAALAAALWAGRDAVLARDSAARLHGLPLPRGRGEVLHLLVRDRCFVERTGMVVHRTGTLPDHHVTVLGAHPVTTATRTVCDLAATLGVGSLRRLVAAAVREDVTDALDLRSCLRELGPVAGTRSLRTLLDELSPLDQQCESEFESVYLRMARRHGIEPTAMNHPVRDATGGRRRLDAVYLPERVWVELDSERFHGTLLDRNDDAIRTASIERAGEWADPLRFTWQDVTQCPTEVAGQVRAALAAASRVRTSPS
jgi:hypothetical protein